MNLGDLLARGEAMHEELGREWYRAGAGLTDDPQFEAIYDSYSDLQGDEALGIAQTAGESTILEWIIDVRVGRQLAATEEAQMRWEQRTTVEVGGRSLPYLRIPIEIANTGDRGERIELDRVRAEAAAMGLVPLRRERFEH